MVTIVNYGMGNLGSVQNMFKRIGVPSQITSDLNEIAAATKIMLPGVGAFAAAMQLIHDGGFREVLDKKALVEKVPVMGICLGMQLLTNSSEEGNVKGLSWVDAETKKFSFEVGTKLKVPHMGWNLVNEVNPSELTKDLPEEPRFYFVHSYYVQVNNKADQLMTTHFGHDFDSIIQHENIYGAQFHPEKSHKFGMKLLENFANL